MSEADLTEYHDRTQDSSDFDQGEEVPITVKRNAGDVLALGPEAVQSVSNPQRRFTGAIHVYEGDFVNQPRSQWDPDSLIEKPHDMEQVRRLFHAANAEWIAQLGTGLDEEAR